MLKKLAPLLLLLSLSYSTFAANSFKVDRIIVRGNQRLSQATVLNYIPLHKNQLFDSQVSSVVIQKLYATGFFSEVGLFREGNSLVVQVKEYPIISLLQVNGNKAIDSKQLKTVLKKVGVVAGQTFSPAKLKSIEVGLKQQYGVLGYHAAKINTQVKNLSQGVALYINIDEGSIAKVKGINFIGNRAFSRHTLLKQFKLTTSGITTWFTHNDRYSPEKLAQDLQQLKQFYGNNGYLEFRVAKKAVKLTPDNSGVEITLTLDEGNQYRIGGFTVKGDTLGQKTAIIKKITLKAGDIFVRNKIVAINRAISELMADKGYAFTNVGVATRLDKKRRLIWLTFEIQHGQRVYVRHITFSGNQMTQDPVLRREMRQMEGAPYSLTRINESKARLQRLPYLQNVTVNNQRVAGRGDQVDLNYKVNEVAAGKASVQAGYSDAYGFLYGAGITQPNFMGTGKSVSIGFQNDSVNQYYNVSYFNPYYTVNGVGRGFNIYYSTQSYDTSYNYQPYVVESFGLDIDYSFPLSEHNAFGLTFGYSRTGISRIQNDFSEGASHAAPSVIDFLNGRVCKNGDANCVTGKDYNIFKTVASWNFDNRDRAVFPTKGLQQSLSLELGVPVLDSSLGYYKTNYTANYYVPIGYGFVLNANTRLGYGGGYGDTKRLPFFLNYYAGGLDGGVPGYDANSLGPKNTTYSNAAIGGNLLTTAGIHLILPSFISQKLRTALTLDAGNVFQTPRFAEDNEANGVVSNESFSLKNMRSSAGFLISWYSPLGPLSIGVAFPLDEKPNDDRQVFQFSFGTNF